VIAPTDTRKMLCSALKASHNKREELPYKRNGNVPL
jgi:acetyl-CoA carboxylase carboxyltransferase component